MKIIFIFLFLLMYGLKNSSAQVAVIANKSVKIEKISNSELLDLYTGDVRVWEDKKPVIVYNLDTKDDIKNIFYSFLGKNMSRMKSIWMKRMLSGEGDPPQSFKTEKEMLKKVSETKGAVGFVNYDSVTTKVKILAIIEAADK